MAPLVGSFGGRGLSRRQGVVADLSIRLVLGRPGRAAAFARVGDAARERNGGLRAGIVGSWGSRRRVLRGRFGARVARNELRDRRFQSRGVDELALLDDRATEGGRHVAGGRVSVAP